MNVSGAATAWFPPRISLQKYAISGDFQGFFKFGRILEIKGPEQHLKLRGRWLEAF